MEPTAPREPAVRVELVPADSATARVWAGALQLVDELNEELGDDWCLVGGLMVQLHVTRYGDGTARPTDDIDILGDSRKRPSATERIAQLLAKLQFTLGEPTGFDFETAYRFTRGEDVVDVLGADGTKRPPKTLAQFTTIQIQGGTQALHRAETVLVVVDGKEAAIRCPTLAGAILLKARAIMSPQRVQDREDLIRLLLCVGDPRGMSKGMKKSERKWLRDAGKNLDLEGGDLRAAFSSTELATARATYNLLLQSG